MNLTLKDTRFDVLGIGNAIVDIVTEADVGTIERLGLEKGAMTLVDEKRSEDLYREMQERREVSGGSCANTMAAIADMGGRGAYIGKVRNDRLGETFRDDIRKTGVSFETAPSLEGPLTARCLIFVTPDAQRTMQTYLGACVELVPEDVDESLVAESAITYVEGYLWDRPLAKQACLKALTSAHRAGRRFALTLSDSFCVDRWREEFLELVDKHVDILFANEKELVSLYQGGDFQSCLEQVRSHVELAVLTRSGEGSVVCYQDQIIRIEPDLRGKLTDTTGAGDIYAAGFLRGLTGGLDLESCGRLASAGAGTIICQYGARAEQSLRPLYDAIAETA